MKINALRVKWICGLLFPAVMMIGQEKPAPLVAKITLPGGTTQSVRLEGVGCSAALCSRVAIQAKGSDDSLVKTLLASLAAIKETSHGDALFVLKDGTSRRVSLMKDFRVLYLANPSGSTRKLDLSDVESVEFLPAPK